MTIKFTPGVRGGVNIKFEVDARPVLKRIEQMRSAAIVKNWRDELRRKVVPDSGTIVIVRRRSS